MPLVEQPVEQVDGMAGLDAQRAAVLRPIRAGEASSKADLARATGLSPTTVAARVAELIAGGHVVEQGLGTSGGGRRPLTLAVRGTAGLVGCIDLGVHRTSIALADFAGALHGERHLRVDLAQGPRAVLRLLVEELRGLAQTEAAVRGAPIRGWAVAVPGPVDSRTGRITGPSRMPGWNGADVPALLRETTRLPAVIGNDANLMALGEAVASGIGAADLVFVLGGSGIGAGIVANGALHTGVRGAAGDISHAPVPGGRAVPCSCGRVGCLDVLASGSALVREMGEEGRPVDDVEQVIDLAADGDPLATRLLREAGAMTGGVLATIVNFFNPGRLVLGGALGRSDAYTAAVRSVLWDQCLPMATEELVVAPPRLPTTAGLTGASRVFLDRVFAPVA